MSVAICMWSGPRNLSTAMMRSFGSRADCAVWDEPFFAPFLHVSGVDHPGREETLLAHETNPVRVAHRCTSPSPTGEAYFFQKHMPHHMLPNFPLDWTHAAKHFFLIRDPARVIASYIKGRETFIVDDLGFAPQRRLFDYITDLTGQAPPVIDSQDILRDPQAALTRLCDALNIPFDPVMLSWEKGSRPEDGAWAPYWYASVEASTGFGKPLNDRAKVPQAYHDMLKACKADYEVLSAHKMKV